jgi:succinate dehydrogenase/fumarate reductase flavoprotein subunit
MFGTVKGSDYWGDQDAIEIMARDAPRTLFELEHMGVPFLTAPLKGKSPRELLVVTPAISAKQR